MFTVFCVLLKSFGSTAEIGIYEMLEGKHVKFQILLKYWFRIKTRNYGTAIASTLEGMRPLMIEIQSW
jgi:DNA repair protein RadA/Sms